jgi:hypothetical protein
MNFVSEEMMTVTFRAAAAAAGGDRPRSGARPVPRSQRVGKCCGCRSTNSHPK